MKKLLFILPLLAVVLFSGCGKKPPVKAQITFSGPEGMTIAYKDKVWQKNPQKLALPAGSYVFRFSAPGCCNEAHNFIFKEGESRKFNWEPEKLNGYVLLTSRPAGAEVFIKQAKIGTTPLVRADLPAGEYEAELRLPGYAVRTVKWRIDSERPIAVNCDLEINTGILQISANAPHARLFVNDVESGVLPKRLERAEGRYRLRAEAPGYNAEERTVEIQRGVTEKLSFRLTAKPAVLTVESEPIGAEFFINGEKRGVTPCKMEGLRSGHYQFSLKKEFYDTLVEDVTLIAGSNEVKRYTLTPSVGSCRAVIRPAGVTVMLDGRMYCRTKLRPGDSREVEAISLNHLAPGKHVLTVTHTLANPATEKIIFKVEKGKTAQVNHTMWVADCEIVYLNDDRQRGMLLSENNDTIFFGAERGASMEIKKSGLKEIHRLK